MLEDEDYVSGGVVDGLDEVAPLYRYVSLKKARYASTGCVVTMRGGQSRKFIFNQGCIDRLHSLWCDSVDWSTSTSDDTSTTESI